MLLAKVGPSIGAVLRFVPYAIVGVICFVAGMSYLKLGIEESNVEVIQNDSVADLEITLKEEELKNEVDEWLESNNPVDANGNPTREWLQFLESQRATARKRGDQRSIIRKITKM